MTDRTELRPAETVAETAPTRHETPDVAELRRWLSDMQSLAERESIYDGNASVRSIVVRVLPMLDRLAHMTEARDNARAEVERLTGQIDAVRALHHRHLHRDPSIINGPWYCCGSVQLGTIVEGDCDECRDSWPCPTIRALDATLDGEAQS